MADSSSDTSSSSTSESKECQLTDAGKYAFSGLAANILAELYNQDEEREFRHKLLCDLMISIELPEGPRRAQIAVADGEYKTRPEPFIDLLLKEDVVKKEPESLLTSLLLVAIKDGEYDARVRVVVEHMSWLLRVDMKCVELTEDHLLEVLKSQKEISEEEKARTAKKSRNTKIKRGFLIGLATVVGGTVIGLTGGLAAPLIATGVGAIIGTAGGAALGSVAGVAIIGSLFGVAGAGLTGYKMKKRVGGVEQFEFDVLSEGSQMTLTIAVSGWVSQKGNEDFRTPWLALDNTKEQYYLKYEGRYLQELGQSMETLSNLVIKQAIAEGLKYTVLSTLMAAVAFPSAMLGLASIIDNPWHVCTKRAENAGKQLAEVLISRQHGQRPVTLVGFSLGARVIFYCLRELSRHPRGAGIVENAYLLGAPVSGEPAEWEPFAKVVAGRVVNAYIRNDWMLKFLYRTASVQFRIAGIRPVQWDNRRMINMDLTNIVNGHMDYMKKMPTVLEAVGIKTKEVKNLFMTASDSGYSTTANSPKTTEDSLPLVPKKSQEESDFELLTIASAVEEAGQSGEGAETESETPYSKLEAETPYSRLESETPYSRLESETPYSRSESETPYSKLESQGSSGSLGSTLTEKKVGVQLNLGETTDSDKSLAEKLVYEQLVDQGSSDDGSRPADVKPKHKLVKVVPVSKVKASEKLLGEVVTKDKLLANESSDDSILSNHTQRKAGESNLMEPVDQSKDATDNKASKQTTPTNTNILDDS